MAARDALTGQYRDPRSYLNRELSWLAFARRVVALADDPELPLLERLKFVGIAGMLHDEFFMKRMSGLKRQINRSAAAAGRTSIDGMTPSEEFHACRVELVEQVNRLDVLLAGQLLPALEAVGMPIHDHNTLERGQKSALRDYFAESVAPILTPLAVDAEHPFPFISNLGLNLAILFTDDEDGSERFIRIKVPNNRPRWVPLPGGAGFVPIEEVITANLDLLYPDNPPVQVHYFRVTRGAHGDAFSPGRDDASDERPGGILDQVSKELKARRFAGVVRLQIDARMPERTRRWLERELRLSPDDVYATHSYIGLSDLLEIKAPHRPELHYPAPTPVTHPRLEGLPSPRAIFKVISEGDILLHHPYHSFDTSVLRLLEAAAVDPSVLAIKLTIYRTSADSPIVKALAEAARSGKQVAVLVEVMARFDEAPNIAWGRYLENEGVHVAYGVEDLKTHVKLALVVREEGTRIRRYAHIGTGNYHTVTARIYEDIGILTSDPTICEDVASIFNALTGATAYRTHSRMIVAPLSMRERFTEMIRREAEHARAGRPSGIQAKMNQLQDQELIAELYEAGQAGVPINLNVRGLCCLRPGVPGLSDNIRVFSVVGRFLEHSRIYRFENGGEPEHYIGSADWMKRNLNGRVETVVPILDATLRKELDVILQVYHQDNCSAWDCSPDGVYVRRAPKEGEPRHAAQEIFVRLARGESLRQVLDWPAITTPRSA